MKTPCNLLCGLWFVAWTSAASAVEVSCKEWNTESFFKRAGAADVVRCVGAGNNAHWRDYAFGEPPIH